MSSVLHNPISRSVGRPREFDEAEVLHAAMDVFWRQGYEGTSMADLLAATGLHKGSLYQAFGDKRTLFIRALRHYIDIMRGEIKEIMDNAESAREGLRAALHKAIDAGCDGDNGNPGCMALNTLVEKGTTDDAILAVLQDEYVHRMKKITLAVAGAQEAGDIRKDWSPEQAAGMIHTMLAGLTVSLKGPMEPQAAKDMVDDFLGALG